jgi:hypothetical protein
MSRPPVPPLSRDRAWSCIMMNVATPGVGSLRAKRVVTGLGQLGFALTGFFLICGWMLKFFYGIFQEQLGETVSPQSTGWMWKWGAVCFGVSWLWTFITCVSLYRRAKAHEQAMRENPPPRILEVPPNQPGAHGRV